MKACKHNAEYLAEERKQLGRAMLAYRQRLARTRGAAVDRKEAERKFLAGGLESFRNRFHRDYCGGCPDHGGCQTAAYWTRTLDRPRRKARVRA